MRRSLIAVGLACGSLFLGHPVAQACGDKLLGLVRGVRFQRAHVAARPASILIYLGGNSKGKTVGELQLQSTLKQAGHKLQLAGDAGQLDQLLQSGRFDLVLADFSEAAVLSRQAKTASSQPTVLPMMYRPTKSELTVAEKQYSFILKAPGKAGEYLLTIEEAMKVRAQGARS